jgi:hypothetical protein
VTRALIPVLLLLGGCSWSNSLYSARRLSDAALKAEREERTFDAGSYWGQAAVRADSAYQRDPLGDGGVEALWLRGRALARLGECTLGVPLMERALVGSTDRDWREELQLELARCEYVEGDPENALRRVMPLVTAEDERLRAQARGIAGRSLTAAQQWEAAVEFLDGDATLEGTWLHANALARLGRSAEALALVQDRIVAGDSTAFWDDLFRALASTGGGGAAADLRSRLGAHPWANDTIKQRWDMATATAMMSHDSAVGTLMLEQVIQGPRTSITMQARLLLADQLMTHARDDTSLVTALARIEEFGVADPTMRFATQRLSSWGRGIRADLDTLRPGAAEGDLALFFHATVARDSLRAPALAAWLLQRLERDWPDSPYVPKALLFRMVLQPDSLAALRQRFEARDGSPYLAFVQGREDPRFAELEWALDFYFGERFATTDTSVEP